MTLENKRVMIDHLLQDVYLNPVNNQLEPAKKESIKNWFYDVVNHQVAPPLNERAMEILTFLEPSRRTSQKRFQLKTQMEPKDQLIQRAFLCAQQQRFLNTTKSASLSLRAKEVVVLSVEKSAKLMKNSWVKTAIYIGVYALGFFYALEIYELFSLHFTSKFLPKIINHAPLIAIKAYNLLSVSLTWLPILQPLICVALYAAKKIETSTLINSFFLRSYGKYAIMFNTAQTFADGIKDLIPNMADLILERVQTMKLDLDTQKNQQIKMVWNDIFKP